MKRALALPALLALSSALVTAAGSPADASSSSLADLQHRLHVAFASSTASVQGVAIDIDGIGQVYRSRSATAQPPASTEKLYTGLAALRVLGPQRRYTTQVKASAAQVGATLKGNLFLVAAGDPALLRADLDHLAAAVAATGTKRLDGRLYVDDSRYDRVTRGPGWKSDFVPDDSGPVSALTVDHNAWRSDRAFLADPAIANLGLFRSLLLKHGVSVSSSIGRATTPATARVVTSHQSRTVQQLLRPILKDSDNLGAELLLKEIGRVRRGAGSTGAGAAVVRDVMKGMGVTVGVIADGSGLSNKDRQTVSGELSLLAAAQRGDYYSALRGGLPIACRDGTLKKRMCGTAAQGRVVAKTGTLDVVHALSGWTTTKDGRVVRFSFLMQGFTSGSKANAAMDAAAVALSAADLR